MRAGVVVAVSIVAGVLLAVFPPLATEAHAQVEGLEVDGTTTYRLDPGAGLVGVTVEVELVNTMPSRTRGYYVETPYFDAFAVPALGPIANPSARSSSGGELSVEVERQDGVDVVVVDLAPNLVHGAPQTVTVEFDLPGQPSRSESVTRVNEAFAAWLVFGAGDAGRVDIVVDVPESFTLSLSRDLPVVAEVADGRRIHRITRVASVDDAVVFASARDDERLATRQLTVLGADITVKAWPDDDEWRDFAVGTVTRGLPVLEDVVGQELPEDELAVVESSAGYHLGYAGMYIPVLGVVEVGDLLDQQVMLHELSHVWLNRRLFTDRWVYEGLAEVVSNRAMEALGEETVDPQPIDGEAPGAVRLNGWSETVRLDEVRTEVEQFAYNASYAVVHELVDEIGADGLRAVIAAATDDEIAYRGDPPPEQIRIRNDWRYFYDLVELVGDSTRAEELFAAHVVTDDQKPALARRTQMRTNLDALVAAGHGWSPPLEVREEMARWDFDDAAGLIDDAHELLDRAGRLSASLAAVDLDPAPVLEDDYETAGDLDALTATVDEFEQVGRRILAAHDRREQAGPVAKLGLMGVGDGLDRAGNALESGELDAARSGLAQAGEVVDRAPLRGSLLLVALILLAATTTAHVRIRSR